MTASADSLIKSLIQNSGIGRELMAETDTSTPVKNTIRSRRVRGRIWLEGRRASCRVLTKVGYCKVAIYLVSTRSLGITAIRDRRGCGLSNTSVFTAVRREHARRQSLTQSRGCLKPRLAPRELRTW